MQAEAGISGVSNEIRYLEDELSLGVVQLKNFQQETIKLI
jgi:hypothetical protein